MNTLPVVGGVHVRNFFVFEKGFSLTPCEEGGGANYSRETDQFSFFKRLGAPLFEKKEKRKLVKKSVSFQLQLLVLGRRACFSTKDIVFN